VVESTQITQAAPREAAGSVPRVVLQYAGTAFLSLVISVLVFQLWRADLRVPLDYHRGGDALVYQALIKGMAENGWFLENDRLGRPGELQLQDFPLTETLHLAMMKCISLALHQFALVLNVFYLFTYPLTALAALFAFRRLGVSVSAAVVAALLYAFLPYHLQRGEVHLLLAAYYTVPLMALVVLRVADGVELLPSSVQGTGWKRRVRMLWPIAVCILVGSSGTYYAYFGAFLLSIAAGLAAIRRRTVRALIAPGVLVLVLAATVAANAAPTIVYHYRHGPNREAVARSPQDAETYGFRITQALLPATGHRIPLFARAKQFYSKMTSANENDTAALGIVGAGGFAVLLGVVFLGGRGGSLAASLCTPALLNLASVLLATVGGFGSLISFLGLDMLRGYNRISVYLGFFSLLAAALIFDALRRRFAGSPAGRVVFAVLPVLILAIGLLDQTTAYSVPPYNLNAAQFGSEARFIEKVESALPANASVFQLPYCPFPEGRPLHEMTAYDLFRAYLHSSKLRWSFGTMKGRETDLWQRSISGLPAPDMVDKIVAAGFSGVYVDSYGYEDGAVTLREALKVISGRSPVVSDDGRLFFYSLVGFQDCLTPQGRQQLADKLLYPPSAEWIHGWSVLEGIPRQNWRWCASSGDLVIYNSAARGRKVRLEMAFSSGYDSFSRLSITGEALDATLRINSRPSPYSVVLTIPPGQTILHFESDAPRVVAPGDPRVMVFRVHDFRMVGLF
jgi:phosphoglycerol transferase